ncbi:MAG: hypothetical protein MHM6MM_007317 [Cercozoa sp. M6MM]
MKLLLSAVLCASGALAFSAGDGEMRHAGAKGLASSHFNSSDLSREFARRVQRCERRGVVER